MVLPREYDAEKHFRTWLSDWHRFRQTASIGGQLAVVDALAAVVPDSPIPLLDEIGMWAQECNLTVEWDELRRAFETSLWPRLPSIETRWDECPHWYTEAFYWMPLSYRRAALFVSFLDFTVQNLPGLDPAPFETLKQWLVAVARWSHIVESSGSEELSTLSRTNRLSKEAAARAGIPTPADRAPGPPADDC